MRTLIIILLSVFTLLCLHACTVKEPQHLGPTQMSKLLIDLQAAESYAKFLPQDSLHPHTSVNMDSLARYYKIVLQHHQISAAQLDDNLNWYALHPNELDSVYVKIMPTLSRYEEDFKPKK